MLFPWQLNEWHELWRLKQNNRLAHAFLFIGIPGIGKTNFADHFTRALFCQQNKEGNACDACHACRLLSGRAHPNVLWIEPEKSGHAIKIDQIREGNEFIQQSSLQNGYRVLLVTPADNMNRNSANALLKTLEEPSHGAIIILITDQSKPLPATILSRCQRFTFREPQKDTAIAWLKKQCGDHPVNVERVLHLANGAPLSALQLIQNNVLSVREHLFEIFCLLGQRKADPLVAAKTVDGDLVQIINFIISWLCDLLRLQLEVETIVNSDYKKQLIELMHCTTIKKKTQFLDYIQQLRQQICSGLNLNKQLMLEDVFIRWVMCHVPG